jgi:hypothetical protein
MKYFVIGNSTNSRYRCTDANHGKFSLPGFFYSTFTFW